MLDGYPYTMFETICIKGNESFEASGQKEPIDLGGLAEALLFYHQVHVIADRRMLPSLISGIGPEVLFELLEEGFLDISYLENFTAIVTENTGTVRELHKPVLCVLPHVSWDEYAPQAFSEVIGCSPKGGKRFAKRFSKHIKPICFEDSVRVETLQDLVGGKYVQSAIGELIKYLAPEYRQIAPLRFEISQDGDGFHVETNVDFEMANRIYHSRVSPEHSSLSVANLLSNLIEARGNWHFSSRLASEIQIGPIGSVIFGLKFGDLLAARQRSDTQINAFQDFVFDDGRALSEAINSGDRSFRDLLKLLRRASRFRDWVREKEPDQQLVKEYFREVLKESWVDKLPPKTVRWGIFTGVGLGLDALGAGGAGTVAGIAISAIDEFLIDKLISGWKPNQFVRGPLQEFVRTK